MRLIHAAILGIALCRPVYATPAGPEPDVPTSLTIPLNGGPIRVTQKVTTTETAGGTGIGAHAQGDTTAIQGQNFTAPNANLSPAPNATGGAGDVSMSAKVTGTFGFRIGIGIFGGLLIAVGIFGAVKLGWSGETLLGCVGVGAICITRAIFPVIGEILTVGGLLLATIFWLKASHSGSDTMKALRSAAKRVGVIRSLVPAVKTGMQDAAKLAELDKKAPLHPLAAKVIADVGGA